MRSTELTKEAIELIEKCPYLVNRLAEKVNRMIDNWEDGEDVEIVHVGYSAAECGYEK